MQRDEFQESNICLDKNKRGFPRVFNILFPDIHARHSTVSK